MPVIILRPEPGGIVPDPSDENTAFAAMRYEDLTFNPDLILAF